METNTMRITPYKIEYSTEGSAGEMIRYARCFDSEAQLFRFASHLYAFDDLIPVEVHLIKCRGIYCKYIGWTPGMRFIFVNKKTCKVVFDNAFPEWDH